MIHISEQGLNETQIENIKKNLGIKSPSKMMRDSWFGEEPCVAEPNKTIPFETIEPIDYDIFLPQPDLPLRICDYDPVTHGREQLKVEENIIYTNCPKEQIENIFSAYTDYSKIYDERNPKNMNDSVIKYNEAMDAAKKAYDEAKLAAQREKEQAELAEANEKVASAMKGLYDAYIAQGFTPEQAEKFVTIALEKACCKI